MTRAHRAGGPTRRPDVAPNELGAVPEPPGSPGIPAPADADLGEPWLGEPWLGEPWHLTPWAKLVAFWGCVAAAGVFLWAVRGLLPPFVVALILAYVLNPVVTRVSAQARVPRALAVTGVYLGLAMLLTWGGLVLFPLASREAGDLAATLPLLIVQVQDGLAAQPTLTVFGAEVDVTPLFGEFSRTLAGPVSDISRGLVKTAVNTFEILLKGLLALVASFYLLMDADRLKRGVRALTPPGFRQEFGPVVSELDRVLGRFVRGEVVLVAIMSLVTWLALTVLGIPYALVLGLLAGVLELIPFLGPILAAAPAVALALFQPSPHGWSPLVSAGVVALAYFVLRHAEDYFVIPQVVGRVVGLHPLVAMFAVFSGAALGGILGMFLGVPVAAAVRVLARYGYGKLTEEP